MWYSEKGAMPLLGCLIEKSINFTVKFLPHVIVSWLSNSYQKTREYFSPSCMMDDGSTETDLPCHYVGIGSRHSSASFGLVAQLVTQIKKCWHFDIRIINYRIKSMWKKNLTWRILQISQCVHKQFRSAVDGQTTGGSSHIFDTILRWYWVNNSEKKVKVSRLQFRWIQLEWFIHSLNAIFSYFFCGSFLAAQHFQNKSNHKL